MAAGEPEALKSMVLSFRVSELQMLLGFAGRNKSGRKTELQARAVDLLRLRSLPIQMKIKELYKLIQQGAVPGSSGMPVQQPVPSPPHKEIPMAHNNPMQQQVTQQRSGVVYNPSSYPTQPPANRGTMFNAAMYHHYPPKPHQQPQQQSYPIHPDVKLKKLPFSEVVGELIKPSTLVPHGSQRMQESAFTFHLTPQQATLIAQNRNTSSNGQGMTKMDYLYQVQMRFCLLETSCDQDDCFPPGAAVKVNNKSVQLPNPIPTNKPNLEPKRPPRPVNVTPNVKLSPTVANNVQVSWTYDYGRGYACAIYLIRKLTSSDLLLQLTKKGSRHPDYTRGLIKEKLNEDADCEIATTSLRVSLACPLGKMRMATPCRATTCQHMQCFDASLYLQMNEKKPTWNCPVCDKPALYDNLVIDGYFQEVLSSGKLSSDGNEIQLLQDGSWTAMNVKKDKQELCLTPVASTSSRIEPKVETVEDLDVLPLSAKPEPKKPAAKADVIDLTISDSDDDEVIAKTPATSMPVIKTDSTNHLTDSSSSSGSTSTVGGSVSSSGYRSPNVITLDSPSPPVTPVPQNSNASMQQMQQQQQSLFYPSFLDVDSDSNSPLANSLYCY